MSLIPAESMFLIVAVLSKFYLLAVSMNTFVQINFSIHIIAILSLFIRSITSQVHNIENYIYGHTFSLVSCLQSLSG